MPFWANLDARLKARDAQCEAWLDRHLSPVFDAFIAAFPLIVLGIIAVMFLL